MGKMKYNLNFKAPVPWGLRGGAKAININAIFKKIFTPGHQADGMILISIELPTKILKFMV